MTDVELTAAAQRCGPHLVRWSERLRAARLDGLVGTLLNVFEPLGPVGAQVLWVAQPALGMWMSRDVIGDLARVLEAPGGVVWLREQLVGPDGAHEDGEQG